jgi:hypothetical protein
MSHNSPKSVFFKRFFCTNLNKIILCCIGKEKTMYFGLAEVLSLQITKKVGSANRKSAKCHKYANLTKVRKLADLRCAKQCGAYMIQLYCHTCTVTLHPGTPLLTVADTNTEPDNVNFGLGRPAFTVVSTSFSPLRKWPF